MKRDLYSLTRLVFLAGFVFLTTQTFAATFNVNSQLDTVDAAPGNGICADSGGACTLRAAIREANALAGSDTINLPAGTFTTLIVSTGEDANANGDLDIAGSTIITGAGTGNTFVEANAVAGVAIDRVFDIQAGATVTIENLTVRNGKTTGFGGGVRNLGTLTLKNSVVRDNQAVSGTGAGAGGIRNEGTITIENSSVLNNLCQLTSAACFGGGMYSTGSGAVTITGSYFNGNTSTSTVNNVNGVGHAAGFGDEGGGTITITNSSFNGNTGNGRSGNGGSYGTGIGIAGSASVATTVNITDSNLNNNIGNTANGSKHGGVGAAFFSAGTFNATLTRVTINGNSGGGDNGGGLRMTDGGTLILNGCNITNNTLNSSVAFSTGAGLAVMNTTTATINNSNITGNTATAPLGNGGGIQNSGSTVTLNGTTVSGNSASNYAGVLTTAQSTTSSAVTTLNRSTVSGNTAASTGSGLATLTDAVFTSTTNINNSTVSGNSAGGSGGGVYMFGGLGTVNISFSTITNNTADSGGTSGGDGGGIRNNGTGGAINIKNSILYGNLRLTTGSPTSGRDCAGTLVSGDYNSIGIATGCSLTGTTTNNTLGVDPQLGSLALNGGLTVNHLPAATSPVLESIPSGTNLCGTAPFDFDQKGVVRPYDADSNGSTACDRGAIERGMVITTPSNLPTGSVGTPYNTTVAADLGTGPYVFTLIAGDLPLNLNLMPDGTITGTPITAGNYIFTIRVEDSHLLTSIAPNVSQKDFELQILQPTTASALIGGRVVTADGMGIRNATVMLSGGSLTEPFYVPTGSMGYYAFPAVSVGQTYMITVTAKRFRFSNPSRVVTLMDNLTDADFVADP